MALERADVGILRPGAGAHRAFAQVDALERRFCRFGVILEQRALRDHGADRALDIALREVMTLDGLCVERLQHSAGGVAAVTRSGDGDVIAAGIDEDAEPALDLRQVLSIGADQRGGGAIVIEVDDDLRLGRDLHVAVNFCGERAKTNPMRFLARVQAPMVM